MKKKFLVLLIFAAVFAFGAAACGPTDTPAEQGGYTVRFDADGGNFASGAPDPLTVKEGESLLEAVKDVEKPSKSGLTFGNWFDGETELAASYKMPAHDVTLKAKYKVEYTVERYLENVAGTSYVRDEQNVTGLGWVDSTVSPEPVVPDGFFMTDSPDGGVPVTTLTLSAQASQNVFRFYFARRSYVILYESGLDGATGRTENGEAVYGAQTQAAECGFEAFGYRFAGWAETPASSVARYRAGDLISVTGNMTLYAVWNRGYFDRYGSNDVIFFDGEDPALAVLVRGGREFEGERNGDEFTFRVGAGKTLSGKVFGSMFAYAREELQGIYELYDGYADPRYHDSGAYFDDPARFTASVTLDVDEYLNAVYTQNGVAETGTLEYDGENGDYIFTGETSRFNCIFGESAAAGHPLAFSVSGGEADVYLDWRFIGETGLGFSNGDVLLLDGYGSALLYHSVGGFNMNLGGTYYVQGEFPSGNYLLRKIYCEVNDPYGMLGDEAGIYGNYLYTFPLGQMAEDPALAGYSGYVVADETYRGEFSGSEGTLVLDGFGNFSDSAVFTVDGTERSGGYTVENSYLTGPVVTVIYNDGGTAAQRRYLLDLTRRTYTLFEETQNSREYRLVTSMLDFPLIVIADEETAGKGFKTDLYYSDNNGYTVTLAATGYSTRRALFTTSLYGGTETSYLYTFTREGGPLGSYIEEEVPETLVFYTTQIVSSETLGVVAVYCVLEEDGEAKYLTVELEEGTLWANGGVTLAGIGSLLFRKDGTVTEGSFSRTQNSHFAGSYGSFLYGDGNANYTLLFDMALQDDGTYKGEAVENTEQALYFYHYDEETGRGTYVIDLYLDGKGNASWNSEYGYGQWLPRTYKVVGSTLFGTDIYALSAGGSEQFRFIIYNYTDANGNLTPIYFLYDKDFEGTFTSENGETLVLDGFYYASYSGRGETVEGTYSVNADGVSVYFEPDGSGNGRFFELGEDGSFVTLDEAYGEWYVVNSSYERIADGIAFFDGKGRLTVTLPGEQPRVYNGIYSVLFGGDTVECKVTVNFGSAQYGQGTYTVSLIYFANSGMYACVLYDADTQGLFIDENWNVLRLDGYGNGTLYTDDRGLVGDGYYYVIDGEKHFVDFTLEAASETYGSDVYLLLDVENRTFRIRDYSRYGLLYFSEEFDYIAFGADGIINVGKDSGYYLAEENGVTAYLYDYETESFRKTEMPLPAGESYSYGGHTFTLYHGGEVETEGSVRLLGKDGSPLQGREPISAKLRFTPKVGSNTDLAASFYLNGKWEEGFTLNFYTDGVLSPRVSYDSVDYPLSFAAENSARTFTVSAGYTSITLQDYLGNFYESEDSHRGGQIVKEWVGFGPVVLEAPKYSGSFYYLYDKEKLPAPLTFSEVKAEDVVINGYRAQLENAYEIVFDCGGVKYAIDFFEYDIYYSLYSFYEYDTVQAGEYTVGVKYLLFNNVANTPGYGRLAEDKGKPYGATLFKADGTAVVTYDCNITVGEHHIWMVEYDAETAGVGTGYLIRYTADAEGRVTAASVETYTFFQVRTAARDFMADVFLDEAGNIVCLLSVAYLNTSGAYTWIDGTSGLVKPSAGSGAWSFLGYAGGANPLRYTLNFVRGDDRPDGLPTYTLRVTRSDGE